ncbi:peptidase, M23 family [gut metagenome]|uniref:Peptidase, M23 family n=1 Tax=gut metagenome TaxID=749906 RepID=J9GCF5_9ZZZZ
MRLAYITTLYIIISILPFRIEAQQYRPPLDIPILLSGNFGELRSNHFHSGIDLKTQGAVGKAIHTAQKGYVSRISVSPWGYGNALYVSHPDGTTTVYAHLKSFSKKIAAYVKRKQYEQERFNVDLRVDPDSLTVDTDEIIALSGNTGSSGGPHLHFEIRDSKSGEVWDPLPYYADYINDTKAPKIQGIQIQPVQGKGVVNNSSKRLELKPATTNGGGDRIATAIKAWGEIGIAVKAYDYMDNTSNIYGVKEITLEADSQVVFHSFLDKFAFDETRYLNSYTDYNSWKS